MQSCLSPGSYPHALIYGLHLAAEEPLNRWLSGDVGVPVLSSSSAPKQRGGSEQGGDGCAVSDGQESPHAVLMLLALLASRKYHRMGRKKLEGVINPWVNFSSSLLYSASSSSSLGALV